MKVHLLVSPSSLKVILQRKSLNATVLSSSMVSHSQFLCLLQSTMHSLFLVKFLILSIDFLARHCMGKADYPLHLMKRKTCSLIVCQVNLNSLLDLLILILLELENSVLIERRMLFESFFERLDRFQVYLIQVFSFMLTLNQFFRSCFLYECLSWLQKEFIPEMELRRSSSSSLCFNLK